MGREARRAQARQERRQRQQQAQARKRAPAVSAPAASDQARRGGGSLLKPRWATDIISELRRVTWPNRTEVFHLTVVVIVVSLLIGMVLGTADLAFGWIVERVVVP
ncbi:MAG: preprotein translocase subunit SecE [Chloroflexi bacterium]|nr:preprotein translocase subunit SecE [Chloroflexota bacterium]MDA1003337.1 preprotein translocase subunit SecE [Chloroflexota bacterium]MQC27771.1 preprotein translocase subunit SecE [Chloroflexota bacterium]